MHDLYVRLYGRLVLAGRWELEKVPEIYRADVEQWVKDHPDGY